MPERPLNRLSASLEAAMVARLYYLSNRQKSEIAEDLGISRFKVARLLDEAREAGIVRISIDMPTDVDLDLGERVAQRFGIRRVIAARTLDADQELVWPVVGAATAQHLASTLRSDDVLGISWGRALTSTVEAFSARTGSDVVQLIGGVTATKSDIGGVELVRRMAAATGGHAYALNAPLLVGSAQIAAALRDDPSLRATISRFSSLTVAVVGVGSWNPVNSAIANELSEAEQTDLVNLGAVADLSGLLLDANGHALDSPLSGRTIGVTLDDLRAVPEVIAVAAGQDKARAIAAVAGSGIISTLVTDVTTAHHLLDGSRRTDEGTR